MKAPLPSAPPTPHTGLQEEALDKGKETVRTLSQLVVQCMSKGGVHNMTQRNLYGVALSAFRINISKHNCQRVTVYHPYLDSTDEPRYRRKDNDITHTLLQDSLVMASSLGASLRGIRGSGSSRRYCFSRLATVFTS